MMEKTTISTEYRRNWRVTLFGILAMQGFALMVGSLLWFVIEDNFPPDLRAAALRYPTFAGGLHAPFPVGSTAPIVADGLLSWYWAIVGAVIGNVFLALALRYNGTSASMIRATGSTLVQIVLVVAGLYFLLDHMDPLPFNHELVGLGKLHIAHAVFGLVFIAGAVVLWRKSRTVPLPARKAQP